MCVKQGPAQGARRTLALSLVPTFWRSKCALCKLFTLETWGPVIPVSLSLRTNTQSPSVGKSWEEKLTDGGLHGQGPDVSLSHTSEVGVQAPI